MSYYFTKDYAGLFRLGRVDYWKCGNCGFTASRTHWEMPQNDWERLNANFHADAFWTYNNPAARPPPYFQMALMLHLLHVGNVTPNEPWLDWGAGDAKLAIQLEHFFGHKLLNYDRFRPPPVQSIRAEALDPHGYGLVVNTAVFEHVRDRRTLDELVSCVSPWGCLAVHTLVRGEIPADPNWMYLLAVHCAFHTNRSMKIPGPQAAGISLSAVPVSR